MCNNAVRGDLDTDGDCDVADEAKFAAVYQGFSTGYGVLGSVASSLSSSGARIALSESNSPLLQRMRWRSCGLGVWQSRDPLGYMIP